MKVSVPLTLTTSRLIASDACRPIAVGVSLRVNWAFEMLKPPIEMFSEPVRTIDSCPPFMVN